MQKEDLFEILGELDDKLAAEAVLPLPQQTTTRKHSFRLHLRTSPETDRAKPFHITFQKLWVSAACLVLMCAALCFTLIRFFPKVQTNDRASGQLIADSTADIAPMVYVNDTLYIQSSDQKGYPEWREEFIYLGTIESAVTSEAEPTQNFQANDPIIGCEVYQYGENLVVRINDAYWLYVKYHQAERDWDSLTEQEKMEIDPNYMGQ